MIITTPEPVKISIKSKDMFQELTEKYKCHYVISSDRSGKSRLTIHTKPELHYKGLSVQEVIDAALEGSFATEVNL